MSTMSAIRYEECVACAKRIAEKAKICPSCWRSAFVERESRGRGIVYAATRVFTSLPDDRWSAIVPYDVVLVDLDEGFQLLGRASLRVPIEKAAGIAVSGRLIDGVPYFEQV